MSSETDRTVLFGILANRLGFLTEAEIVAACRLWAQDKSTPLAEMLKRDKKLNQAQEHAIETVCQHYLRAYEDDPFRTLAGLLPSESLRDALSEIDTGVESVLRSIAPAEPAADGRDHGEAFKTRCADRSMARPAQRDSAGRYEILLEHARGGLGEVYLARDTEVGRDVALKQIQDAFMGNAACCERFLLEAEITGSLEHPGIVPVYGLGTRADGRPYYAMRFIRGQSLETAIAELHAQHVTHRALEFRKLLHRFVDICHAIHFAHSRGVLHRDLKPSNIMLGPYGETLVVDWGLARLMARPDNQHDRLLDERTLHPASENESPATKWGTLVGTPAFMSPEQALGWHETLTPASDVYSLGATLYVLLTGRSAFRGGSLQDILLLVQQGAFPRPREVCPTCPRALEAICLKAMATTPRNRYSSARQLADELECYLADEPISAWREPWWVRTGRLMRRHRGLTVGGLVGGAMVVVGLTVLALVLSRAQQREANLRRAAENNFQLAHEAVNQQLVLVTEEPQLKQNRFESLRSRLLTSAREFYQKLLAQRAGDRDLVYEDAWIRFRLGEIAWEIGTLAEAREHYEQARDLFEGLMTSGSHETRTSHHLAMVLHNLSNLSYQCGDYDQADTELKQALEMTRELVRQHPSPALRLLLADCLNTRAIRARNRGQYDNALQGYQEALEIYRTLYQAEDSGPDVAGRLVTQYGNLAILFRQQGEIDKCEEAAFRGAEIGRTSLAPLSDRPYLLQNYADIEVRLAEVYAETNRQELAMTTFLHAKDTLQKLAQPAVNEFRRSLCTCELNLANLYRAVDRVPEALESFQHARTLCEELLAADPENTDFQAKLAALLLNQAQFLLNCRQMESAHESLVKAQDIFARLVKVQTDNPEHQSGLGRAQILQGQWLLASGQTEPSVAAYQAAVETLTAVSEGFPDNPFYRSYLATALEHLGALCAMTGQCEKAEVQLRRAFEIRRQVHQQMDSARSAVELVTTQVQLGLALIDLKRHDEAMSLLDTAVASMQQLVAVNAQNQEARRNLEIAVIQRGLLKIDLQRYGDALADFDTLVSIGATGNRDLVLCQRAACLAHLGRHKEAWQQIDAIRSGFGNQATPLYEAAAILALSTAAARNDASLDDQARSETVQQYAAVALELLERWRADGQPRDPLRKQTLSSDARFQALHDQTAFQQLLQDLDQE